MVHHMPADVCFTLVNAFAILKSQARSSIWLIMDHHDVAHAPRAQPQGDIVRYLTMYLFAENRVSGLLTQADNPNLTCSQVLTLAPPFLQSSVVSVNARFFQYQVWHSPRPPLTDYGT